MFYPQCRSEYVMGVTYCPDCDMDLVENLPSGHDKVINKGNITPGLRNVNWVIIYKPASTQEVALIKMILEREGISFLIDGEYQI